MRQLQRADDHTNRIGGKPGPFLPSCSPCVLFLACVALIVSGCAALSRHPAAPAPADTAAHVMPEESIRTAPAEAYQHALVAMIAERNGDTKHAMEEYLAALAVDEQSVFLHTHVAELLLRQGQLQEAVTYAKRALSINPNHVPSLLLISSALAGIGRPEEAVGYLEAAVRADPGRLDLYYNLGLLYTNVKQFDRARATIRRAIERDPESPVGFYYLGRVESEAGDDRAAIKAYETARTLDIDFVHPTLALGELYEQRGQADKAIALYQSYLDQGGERQTAEVRNRLVQLHLRQKAPDKALAVLDAAVQEDPQDLEARLRRGLILIDLHEYDKAIQDITVVSNAHPNDHRLLGYLAALYEETKNFDRAMVLYERMTTLAPDNPEPLLRLGALYGHRKETARALSYVDRAARIDNQLADVYLVKGYIYIESEQYEAAAKALDAGIAVHPEHADLHFNLGTVYDKLNRFDDLVTQMAAVLKIDPKHANALNYLGYTYADRGVRLDEAVDLIKRALSIKPDEGAFVDSLGWAYYKLGRTGEALKELQRAIQLMPDDAVIQEHLGEVYLKSQRPDEAKAAWLKSLSLDPTNQKLRSRFEAAGFGAAPESPPGGAAGTPDMKPKTPAANGQKETAVSAQSPSGI